MNARIKAKEFAEDLDRKTHGLVHLKDGAIDVLATFFQEYAEEQSAEIRAWRDLFEEEFKVLYSVYVDCPESELAEDAIKLRNKLLVLKAFMK